MTTIPMHYLRINGQSHLTFSVPDLSADELKGKVAQSITDGTPLALDVMRDDESRVHLMVNPHTLTTFEISPPDAGGPVGPGGDTQPDTIKMH